MKKIILVVFLMLLCCLPIKVDALSVSENDVTVQKGNTKIIDLYANVDKEIRELSFNMTFSTYDATAALVLEPGLTDTTPTGISHNIVFSTPMSGKVKIGTIKVVVASNPTVSSGTVNINYPKAITTNGERINLKYQDINIKIGEEVIESNLLEKIESNIVNIELQKDVFEYTVDVKSDIEKLDLKPIAKNNYSVDISNQTISELNNNTITIKVSNNNVTEEYKIKVNVLEEKKEEEKVETKEEIKEETKKQNVEKVNYKGKWIFLIIILTGVLAFGLFLNKKSK